jgi:intracellular septation protein A
VINGAFPLLIYWTLTNYYPSISQFVALVISGIPSLIHSIVGLIYRKRIDFLAGIALATIAISLIVTVLSGDPKILQIRESFLTVPFGLVLLVSLFLPRPFMFYMARHFASGNDPASEARFNLLWQQNERLRRLLHVQTAVWGAGFLLEAAIRITLVLTLSVQQFQMISPFVIYGIIAILVIWTLRSGRAASPSSTERMRRMTAEEQVVSTTFTPTESAE